MAKVPQENNENESNEVIATAAKRYFAFLLDYSIILLLLKGIFPLFLAEDWDLMESNFASSSVRLFYLMGLIFFILKDIVGGQSIGKRFLGMRICNLDKELSPAGLKALLVRNFFLILLPIEMFAMLLDNYARRLGDKYANTLVVEKKRKFEVRQVTIKVIGGLLVISSLWITAILSAPIGIKKSMGYKKAVDSIWNNALVEDEVGSVKSIGYWPEREDDSQSKKTFLRLNVIGEKGETKVEFTLDYSQTSKVLIENIQLAKPETE